MKVAIIMGGISSEREVSLKSGEAVFNGIDKNKYDVVKIVLDSKKDIFTKITDDIDFAFLALHGKFGEDGCVQSILEAMEIPYSGCNPLTSALCMDKNMTKKITEQAVSNFYSYFFPNKRPKKPLFSVVFNCSCKSVKN